MHEKIGDELICPVCGDFFTLANGHKYIIREDHTCSWKCFMDYVKLHPHKTKCKQNVNK